jgi:hypothetical protein
LLSLALVAALMPAAAAALEKSDVLKREFSLAAGVTREVVIDNVMGSIQVRAGTGDRVTIEIERFAEARRQSDLDEAFTEVTLEVIEENDRLELIQDGPFRCGDDRRGRHGRWGCRWDPDYEIEWRWTVTVPADVDLEATTVNGDRVAVDGVRGRVEAGNVNGDLRLSGLVGEVEASTVNGPIHAEYAARPSEAGSFQTVNGEIEIRLPSGSGAEIGFETMNGEIYTDFEVSAVPQRSANKRAGRGRGRYRLDRDTVVRLGAGGPRFDCHTLNGDIVVREL